MREQISELKHGMFGVRQLSQLITIFLRWLKNIRNVRRYSLTIFYALFGVMKFIGNSCIPNMCVNNFNQSHVITSTQVTRERVRRKIIYS